MGLTLCSAPVLPVPRQGKRTSGLEVGSGQLLKSFNIQGVLSECVCSVGVLPEGRQRWHNKDAETQKASVLGDRLSFQPVSSKAELGLSGAEGGWALAPQPQFSPTKPAARFPPGEPLPPSPPMEGLSSGQCLGFDISGGQLSGFQGVFLPPPSLWTLHPRSPAPAWRSSEPQLGGGGVHC